MFVLFCAYSNLFLRRATRSDAERNGKGNLRLATRPYRRQLYTQSVIEIFPYWNGTNVCWVNEFACRPSLESESSGQNDGRI